LVQHRPVGRGSTREASGLGGSSVVHEERGSALRCAGAGGAPQRRDLSVVDLPRCARSPLLPKTSAGWAFEISQSAA